MLKDDHHKTSNEELEEDLQFMLSSIRARENTLIFYLEKFKNTQNFFNKNGSIEMKLAKNEFQQKDKIYSRQVTSILQKHTDFLLGEKKEQFLEDSSVRAFWIKLKTILKVSIERVNAIGIAKELIGKLIECYERALIVIQRNSEAEKSLLAYREVENFFKKRTIEALLISKEALSPSISYSESKMEKNRSETLFKPTEAITRFTIEGNNSNLVQESQFFEKRETFTIASKERTYQRNFEYLHGLADIKEEGSSNLTMGQSKIKSLNRIKNRKPDEMIKANIMNFIKVEQLGKLKSTSKASEKHIKKINKHVERYEKNFEGAFDGKYEVSTLLDKKKTIFENIYLLYDDLFAKNIPNHKMISKFMFNTTKINQILYNAYEKKKKQNKKDKELKDKEKDKEKDNDKKEKTKCEGKEKEKKNNKDKEKEKEKEKDHHHLNDDKEKHHHTAKQLKPHRKNHLTNKEHTDIFGLREKKESETTAMTAMTSKHQTNHKELNYEKHDKYFEKEKDKSDKEKKIQRSKTAKIKLNSEIHNNQPFNVNPGFLINRHFISQHQGHKNTVHKTALNAEKIIKT